MKLASDTAMVMAAGLGKRMRPLTATTPKPLVRVAGRPLIDHALDRIDAAGIPRVVINVHYLADALEAHATARSCPKVIISDERDALLETGGGLVRARQQGLLPDPFFCVNADSIWLDGPRDAFADLSAHWDPERMDALLLQVPHAKARNFAGAGDFTMDPVGRLRRRLPGRIAPFIYTGIQLVSHRLLRDPPGTAFSTGLLWDRAIEEGRLFGTVFTGSWIEVGEPHHVTAAESYLAGG